jgi:hypothetical protein
MHGNIALVIAEVAKGQVPRPAADFQRPYLMGLPCQDCLEFLVSPQVASNWMGQQLCITGNRNDMISYRIRRDRVMCFHITWMTG